MQLQVLFFAQAREHAGCSRLALELPVGSRVRDVLQAIAERHPALAPLAPHLAVAVNGALARNEDAVPEGAELALLPPVSGG